MMGYLGHRGYADKYKKLADSMVMASIQIFKRIK